MEVGPPPHTPCTCVPCPPTVGSTYVCAAPPSRFYAPMFLKRTCTHVKSCLWNTTKVLKFDISGVRSLPTSPHVTPTTTRREVETAARL